MNAPRSTDGPSHDHEDRRPEREEQRQPEPLAGRDAPRGSAPRPEQQPTVPSTPGELVALQRFLGSGQPRDERGDRSRVAQGLALLQAQELNPWECQQIALALLLQLESYHQGVVAELHDAPQSAPAQVACWAIDGDRLMHCRRLLESITLI